MLNNDTTSSSENDTTALRQYDMTLSTTSLSVSVDITHVLSWVNAQLEQDMLSTVRNLDNDWLDGRAFLRLAHRFYPSSILRTTFDSLLDQDDVDAVADGENALKIFEARSSLAFSVFERELALSPPTSTNPHTPIPLYIAKIQQALQYITPPPPTAANDNNNDDIWIQRTNTVLSTIQHIRQLLHELNFRPSTQNDSLETNDPRSTSDNDQPTELSDNDKEDNKATTSWEDDLNDIEQRLADLHRIMHEYHAWTDDNMDIDNGPDGAVPTQNEKHRRLALIQSVDNAHLSLEEYLEHGQQVLAVFRKRALFTQATAPIRQDLDWVQAEMLKTTTTDTGIKELETRVKHAGTLLQQLIHQYNDHQQSNDIDCTETQPTIEYDNNDNNTGQQQQQHVYAVEVDALEKKYQLVRSWVEDVRVWFVEAQRIRKWIGERIDILENSDVPDGVLIQDLTVTADHVEDLNTSHESLEKEVELFDKEDMSRMRTHVKDLTVVGTKEKDLSPADTTTIEITFTTLMTLDRLMHLLNRRSYDLQVLTLRVFWENEFLKTETWVQTLAKDLGIFIVSQARWKADDLQHDDDPNERKIKMAAILSQSPAMKSAIIDKLLEFETDISTFDQGQFTTTVNLYQELDDVSKVDLPNFLESRQVGVEESFEDVVHRTAFARHVVEQYLTMVDFMDTSGNLLYCYGHDLHEKLLQHTGKVHSLFLDQLNGYDEKDGFPNMAMDAIDLGVLEDKPLVDENAYFQEYAMRLITETAGLIPYTETTHTLDRQENEQGNHQVHTAVKSRSSELILYGDSLEYKLSQYQKAIRWYCQLNDVYDELQHIQTMITNDISTANHSFNKLTNTFGDQISILSDELIHDKNTAIQGNRELQQHVDSISIYETGLGDVDDHIQGLLDYYEQPSSTTTLDVDVIPNAVTDTIKYLETGAELVSSHLQNLASTLDQWKSGLSMMKDRQLWESQYIVVTEWMSTHERKCQHIRNASAWSPSEVSDTHQNHQQCNGLEDTTLTLEQEWDVFKNQSLSSLANVFEKLTGYTCDSISKPTWVAQRQRQNGIMSGAENIDDILALTRALLNQRMAITQFLVGAETIRSQGAQRLKHLKWVVSKRNEYAMAEPTGNEEMATVDTYNKSVIDLWQKWISFDNRMITAFSGKIQEGMALELDQQCDTLETHASENHQLLLSLGHSLQNWEDTANKLTKVRHAINIWCEKVLSLDTRADDLYETLTLERDGLLEKLAKDCILTLDGNGGSEDGGPGIKCANQRAKDMDRLLQQWFEHDFVSLCADGLALDTQTKQMMETLLGLTCDEDENWSLDIVNDMERTNIQLDELRSRATVVVQPIMSLVLLLAETSDERDSWEPLYWNMSLILEKLRVRVDDVVLDRQRWLETIHDNNNLAPLHDLLDRVKTIAVELNDAIYSDDGHGLLDAENKCYSSMVKSYGNLIINNNDSYSVQLPSEIELKHDDCQQSIHYIETTVKQLGEDINWLESGANWLLCTDEQFEKWEALMGDLNHFIENGAKWSIDTCGDTPSLFDLNTKLFALQQRVDNLTGNIHSVLGDLQSWKSGHPTGSIDGLAEFDVWNQKASQLDNYRSDSYDYMVYASNLVGQHVKLQDWSKNINQAKLLGEQAKMAMLLDHDNNIEVAAEPLQLLATFDEKLAHVLDCAENMTYPTLPQLLAWKNSTTSIENSTGGDENSDLVIRQYIQSQHGHLNNLSISLNGILSANERSTRLKSLVDGHVAKASEFLQWISTIDNQLQQLVPDNSGMAGELETLNSRLDMMNELERSANEYTDTHYQVLKESANHCITAIQLDSEDSEQILNGGSNNVAQLDRVSSLQQSVEQEWQRLSDSIQQHRLDLEKHIRQAERSYWCKEVLVKCQTINSQLDNANVDTLTDDQLDEWWHNISDIKTTDLDHLRKLFVAEDIGNLDMATQSILDKATMTSQQLGNRLQLLCDDVDLRRRKAQHGDLSLSLIGFTDKTKSTLMELHSTLGALPIQLGKEADDEYYDLFKVRLDTIIGDFGGHEGVYKQESELFLSICDDDDGSDMVASETTNKQHQQVEIGWTDLQQDVAQLENDYYLMEKLRPMFDVLYQVSSVLDSVDTLLNGADQVDVDSAKLEINRVKALLSDAASITIQRDSVPYATDDKNDVGNTMNVIYQQRYENILCRMCTVENQMEYHQKQQQLQQFRQHCHDRMDTINASAQGELATLESLRILNSNLPDTAVSDPLSSTQQYQQWVKQVESSERVLQNLVRDVELLTTTTSTSDLQKGDMDEIDIGCQQTLKKLKEELDYEKCTLDLARRILGLGKSANNITSWLTHFEKAVDEVSTDGFMAANSYDEKSLQALDDKIGGLDVKLDGFGPIMTSLDKMNSAIQGSSQLDSKGDTVESQWKHSARNRVDQVNAQWKNCLDKLEASNKMVNKARQAAGVTLKIDSMTTFLNEIQDQVKQLQIDMALVDSENSSAKNSHQDQQLQLDIKTLSRDRDILSAEDKLATIKRRLTVQGRNKRNELDQLIGQYNDDQQIDNTDRRHFLEQQNEMDATWTSILEKIDDTKSSLVNKKPLGRYLSMVDDIDLLLDSMDEVLLKANPLYHETSTDSKPSKAELRAKLIELNARYNYYSMNIQQNLQHADDAWTAIATDKDTHDKKSTLENYRLGQQTRWKSMVDQQVPSRQIDLKKTIEQPIENAEKKMRPRKASLPTRKAAGTFTLNSRPSKAALATSASSSTLRSSPELYEGRRRLRTVSSTSTLTSNIRPPIRQQGSSSTTTSSSTKPIDSGLSTSHSTKKRSPTPNRKRPNSYVAQAGNDLDMEIGRIVNDTPYRIKVKMVPGEVGRYWFGDINPKLVYCRVLKSKMVMVRVGGGWTELSQFLRDHALLEGELIIPKKQNQLHTSIQEGYLEATTSLQRQRQQLLQQHLEQFRQQNQHSISSSTTASSNPYFLSRTPTPTMRTSISTPPNKNDILRQKGYKDGDKFFAVDRHGNQLEVKMTRFHQPGALPTSATNRRRKLVKS